MRSYRKIRNPAIFQGSLTKRSYYEGWYFKCVNHKLNSVLAFIPTVALNKDKYQKTCFIQILDGISSKVYYIEYPIKEFWGSNSQFLIKIGNSYFSKDRIKLDIDHNNTTIKGEITFMEQTPIPNSLISPGAMGPFSYLPFMQTYHGIISMNHQIRGNLNLNNQEIIYEQGSKGYIEKDWGSSFPDAWIWMQTNHFKEKPKSFMLSIAEIPWMGLKFIGFLSFLLDGKKIYRFATYTGAKIRIIEFGKDYVDLIIEDKKNILVVKAKRGRSASLKAPNLGSMTSRSIESIDSTILVQLYKKDSKNFKNELVFEDKGKFAGLELMKVENLI
ncbi:MAG: tocopherol cyclase family protein [Promethearchaeati archaeon]